MFTLLLIVHVIACLMIIFFVLLQSGRGAELGAAFGGVGQANSVRGQMTGVGKVTTGVAIVFMLTSLSLAYLSSETAKDSVVRQIEATPTIPATQQAAPASTESQGVTLPVEEEKPSSTLEQKEAPPLPSDNTPSNN
ncbi:MAG: preprotein translocase subunit SecG [SAR324 cluster bacterium]|nr:preprotein translocase subunit SecG [SAR324 cluster bacterium]